MQVVHVTLTTHLHLQPVITGGDPYQRQARSPLPHGAQQPVPSNVAQVPGEAPQVCWDVHTMPRPADAAWCTFMHCHCLLNNQQQWNVGINWRVHTDVQTAMTFGMQLDAV